MPNPLEKFSLQGTQENYNENCKTLSYRLSELLFGSLLAAFILGFIAYSNDFDLLAWFLNAITSRDYAQHIKIPSIVLFIMRLVISITYALYTSVLYITYQQTILQMETNPIHSSRDFLVAISLGFTFGISMFAPLSAPIWLSLCVVLTSRLARDMFKRYHEQLREHVEPKLPTRN